MGFVKGEGMKKILGIALAAVLSVGVIASGVMGVGNTASYAMGTDEQKNILQVNGMASYEVTPDIAYVNVGVETKDKDAQKAQSENADKMAKVRKAIKDLGIKKEDMQTRNYSVYTSRDFLKDDKYVDYYVVRNQIVIKVRDLKMLAKVIDSSSQAGANEINNVRFAVQDEESAYQKALQMAIKNANGKAEAILSTFGKKAGMPIRIRESSYGGAGVMRADNEMYLAKNSVSNMATPIEQGKLNITANVVVDYYYGE